MTDAIWAEADWIWEQSLGLVCVCVCVCVCFIIPMCFSPFDVICVSSVVSLQLLIHIVQDDHWGDEIHRFSSGQQVKVGATVSTAVAITGHSKGSRNKSWNSSSIDRGLISSCFDNSCHFSSKNTLCTSPRCGSSHSVVKLCCFFCLHRQ